MRHQRAVAAAYLLAIAAVAMLAYLAAPQHRTALAAGRARTTRTRSTRLAAAQGHGPVRAGGATSKDRKMELLAHAKRVAQRAAQTDVLQKRQSLLYDSVTVGPYGSYDAQTYYFHPNGKGVEKCCICVE